MRRDWTHGRSWVELRAQWAERPEEHGYDPECCEVISYDKALKLGVGPDRELPGWDHAPTHAGFVRRCPKHAPRPGKRTWILDIPLCRLKLFLQYEAGGAFPLSWLQSLLPTNHPKYKARNA